MDKLPKIFDDFFLMARIMPILVVCIPIFVVATQKGMIKELTFNFGSESFVIVALLCFIAHAARERGKAYEEKMTKDLGGLPSTIILRFSDSTIETMSKIRYHQWINQNLCNLQLPLSQEEELEDPLSDSKYAAAMDQLRSRANSNRAELPRVYQELKKYNFWRNLYGCKWNALVLYIVIMGWEVLTIIYLNPQQSLLPLLLENNVVIVLLIFSIIFCLIVTKDTVKRNAFDYAKALLETVDVLSQTAH